MRPDDEGKVDATLDEVWLSVEELCSATGVSLRWVEQRVGDGLLGVPADAAPPAGAAPAVPDASQAGRPQPVSHRWRFSHVELLRVRRMARVERDFEALPELAALVADLQDEIDRLRARLQRDGGW